MTMGLARGPYLLVAALALAAAASCAGTPQPQSTQKNSWGHHYQLGRLYYEQGRTGDALREINTSLKIDEGKPQVWFYRGYIYWNAGEWDKAEADFRQALALEPMYTDARIWLAVTMDRAGHPLEALRELDRALENKTFAAPEQIWFNKALILQHLRRDDEAISALRQAVTAAPRYYPAHFEMAKLLLAKGRSDDAELEFQAAEPGFTKDAMFHFKRGQNYRAMQQYDAARREAQRAMDLAPGSEAADQAHRLLKELP